MTGLRTIWGVSLERIETEFGIDIFRLFAKTSPKFLIVHDLLFIHNNYFKTNFKRKIFD